MTRDALLMLFVFIYVHYYLTRFQYQMMFASFITNMAGVTSEAETGTSFTEPDVIPWV